MNGNQQCDDTPTLTPPPLPPSPHLAPHWHCSLIPHCSSNRVPRECLRRASQEGGLAWHWPGGKEGKNTYCCVDWTAFGDSERDIASNVLILFFSKVSPFICVCVPVRAYVSGGRGRGVCLRGNAVFVLSVFVLPRIPCVWVAVPHSDEIKRDKSFRAEFLVEKKIADCFWVFVRRFNITFFLFPL